MATTAATATNCLDHGKQPRPASPSFMMNAITDNRPGSTANPLLVVNTGHDSNTSSFITPTLVTNHQNHQGNGNTVAFENTIPEVEKQINARLAEIANQGPPLETTVTNCLDRHIPDRCQFTNHREHQYQSTYTNQNRSYNNNYNRNYKHTWENHTDRTCNNCGTKGHIAKYCTKTSILVPVVPHSYNTITQACRSKPRSSTPMESPSAGSYHPNPSHPNNITLQATNQCLCTQHSHPQPHQVAREWAKLLVTHMEEQEYNNREIENRKTYLENIKVYEGMDKQKCLPWVNQLQQAAKCSKHFTQSCSLSKSRCHSLWHSSSNPRKH